MGIRGRSLRVGDDAMTDFNGAGTSTRVTIIEADYTRRHGYSQSGITFRVRGKLRNTTESDWIDAEWFEPAPPLPATADLWPDAASQTHKMREALELIAAPMRPDGTWNRDREACQALAEDALNGADDKIKRHHSIVA